MHDHIFCHGENGRMDYNVCHICTQHMPYNYAHACMHGLITDDCYITVVIYTYIDY